MYVPLVTFSYHSGASERADAYSGECEIRPGEFIRNACRLPCDWSAYDRNVAMVLFRERFNERVERVKAA